MAKRRKHADRIRAAAGEVKTIRAMAGGDAKIAAAVGGAGELRKFSGRAYTGGKMRPEGWFDDVIVDLTGYKVHSQKAPALRQHDHEQIVGHTTRIEVGLDFIDIEGVFSGEEQHAKKVVEPADRGFPWQLSIGADPHMPLEVVPVGKTVKVNGKDHDGPCLVARGSDGKEFSFVPLGADNKTHAIAASDSGAQIVEEKIRLKAMLSLALFARWLKAKGKKFYSDEEIDMMNDAGAKAALKEMCKASEEMEKEDEEEKKKAEAARQAALAAASRINPAAADDEAYLRRRRELDAAEDTRREAIRGACNQYGVVKVELANGSGSTTHIPNLAAHAIAGGWSLDQTKVAILDAVRDQRPAGDFGISGSGGAAYSTSGAMDHVSARVLEWAIFEAQMGAVRRLESSDTYQIKGQGGELHRNLPEEFEGRIRQEMKSMYPDNVRDQGWKLSRNGRMTVREFLNFLGVRSGMNPSQLKSESEWRDWMKNWEYAEQQQKFAGGRSGIQADGTSNMNLPNVLANVLNKNSLMGYLGVEQAWRRFCSIRPAPDFKPLKPINLLGYVMYQQLSQTGELPSGQLYDQAFSNQVNPYGLIITIPWTTLVNDDLGVLQQTPLLIGRGAGLALNNTFYTVFLNPGTADDGNAFYTNSTGTHGTPPAFQQTAGANYISGGTSAFAPGALQLLKTLRDQQVDPTGYPLGVAQSKPILAYPSPLWQTVASLHMSKVYTGISSGASTPADNPWMGEFDPVQSVYLDNALYANYSATAFYWLYEPSVMPAFETAFLNGIDTPAVLTAGPDFQFNRLGISVRGTMPFGVAAQNFRYAYKSAGA